MAESLKPVDTSIRLPKSVRDQVKRAESHYKKEELTPPAPPEVPPIEVPPAPIAAETPPPPAETPPEVPLTAAPETPPALASETPPATNWEHSYKSMKGRYERSEQGLVAMRDRMNELESTIASLQRAPARPRQETSSERLVTEKEMAEYGPELVDIMGRRAKEELNPIVATMQQEIDELKGLVRGTHSQVTKTGRTQLLASMDTQLPKWRELNDNQDFLQWLDLPDRYSGVIRGKLFDAALEQNNTPRVLAFFQGFLAEEAASDPARARVSEPPAPEPPNQKVPLENFAAPGRAKSPAGNQPPAEKPYISKDQITAFYADVNRGKYRGNEAEKDRLERMIFEANAEGRIT